MTTELFDWRWRHRNTDSSGDTAFDGCDIWESPDGISYAYYYPDEDDTQYLYETFPQAK